MRIGAHLLEQDLCEFVVWAPLAKKVEVHLVAPEDRLLSMERLESGYWSVRARGIGPDADYFIRLDGERERPDPASCRQFHGVHKPSRVVDHGAFRWNDGDWRGLPLEKYVLYELHVGTFTPGGTFEDVIPRLSELADLGVTAIEIMPVAAFPGERNWGYDGVHPFAVQESYGGPGGLKALVDACHRKGLAVVLDVVYNHQGPEGNYLREFGPYFTDHYRSPWGEAVNFDGPHSDEVRHFFIENARQWFRDYHMDALRLDAVHAIYDFSAHPFLQELAEKIAPLEIELNRPCLLIAESDLNDTRLIRPAPVEGFGLHAQWNDDFHHALHTLLTGEDQGYYRDFGRGRDLARSLREGFVFSGGYSPYRKRRHGNASADLPGRQFVVCSQNHDQVGNRLKGERLISLAGLEGVKLAAAAVLLSPFVPLLFMGEEYGESNPFQYFVSFLDNGLIQAVREGRKEEFQHFGWKEDPPDPQDTATFERSRLDWGKRQTSPGKEMRAFYSRLLELRREIPAVGNLEKMSSESGALEEQRLVWFCRSAVECRILALLHFGHVRASFDFPLPAGDWEKVLDSADTLWLGPGTTLPQRIAGGERLEMPPLSAALYQFNS